MNDRSSRGPGRRVGREQVLHAAIAKFDRADLADLLGFLGMRAVAEAADVQASTVHHHFGNRTPGGKPNARLAAAVIEACLADGVTDTTAAEAVAVLDGRVDEFDLAALRIIAEANLEQFLAKRRPATATFVAAAAAAQDPVARDVLRQEYDGLLDRYVPMYTAIADHLDRRFDHEHGFTAESFAVMATAFVDGLSIRQQFDPDRVRPELFGEVIFRLFEVATVPADSEAEEDAVVERLLADRRTSLDLPVGSQLDPAKRTRIVEAARALYAEGGVEALTVTAVAREAGVGRGTVISHFGGRPGLAGAVWAQYVPALEARIEADRARGVPLARIVERHLHRLVEVCRSSWELTVLLLEGMTSETIRGRAEPPIRPDDPRTAVPLPALLVPALLDAADGLRPGVAGSPQEAANLSAIMTYLVMARAVIRSDETTSETVQYLMDLLFESLLA